jgi:hypothetical protein
LCAKTNEINNKLCFEKYSDEGIRKEWGGVVLENDYIEVTILPSQGGEIWGAVEKHNGEPFLYFNHAAKFRAIGMRGPWTSGGIEMNFGMMGHVPSTATPVDYCTRTNADGSVSCFVASLDLLTHTCQPPERQGVFRHQDHFP